MLNEVLNSGHKLCWRSWLILTKLSIFSTILELSFNSMGYLELIEHLIFARWQCWFEAGEENVPWWFIRNVTRGLWLYVGRFLSLEDSDPFAFAITQKKNTQQDPNLPQPRTKFNDVKNSATIVSQLIFLMQTHSLVLSESETGTIEAAGKKNLGASLHFMLHR
jgi:hypothetical protein